ncbi:MAG: HlyD family secretion protein, partial [Cyanobacteria bacterium J083]
TINKLETEINNQKAKLAEAKRNNKPEISIKSPIAGLVYQIFIKEGENVEDSQNLLTILNCKNMWLEVVIPTEIATRIATDQPVKIKLDNQPESLSGQVTSLGILNNSIAQAITADSPNTAINISIPPKYQGENLSRIAVNVANLPQHNKDQKFCGVGNNASVTFITNVKSFSEQLQQVWQKQLVK